MTETIESSIVESTLLMPYHTQRFRSWHAEAQYLNIYAYGLTGNLDFSAIIPGNDTGITQNISHVPSISMVSSPVSGSSSALLVRILTKIMLVHLFVSARAIAPFDELPSTSDLEWYPSFLGEMDRKCLTSLMTWSTCRRLERSKPEDRPAASCTTMTSNQRVAEVRLRSCVEGKRQS